MWSVEVSLVTKYIVFAYFWSALSNCLHSMIIETNDFFAMSAISQLNLNFIALKGKIKKTLVPAKTRS